MKYRKKPVVIDAWKVGVLISTAKHDPEILPQCIQDALATFKLIINGDCILIDTLEGRMQGDYTDMLIRGVQGEFYPCKRDIFDATYESAVERVDTRTLTGHDG